MVVEFKRLRIYYYLNVFAQFILLMGVGFMSLILPFNNFMDRVMTALTVMLGMTCNQQVLNVSQKEEEKSITMTKFKCFRTLCPKKKNEYNFVVGKFRSVQKITKHICKDKYIYIQTGCPIKVPPELKKQ